MTPSKRAVDLIKQFEGYAKQCADGGVEAYPDPATGKDPWTIGYGSTGPDIKRGAKWTRAQADARLEADVEKFGKKVADMLGVVPTTQNQFDALTSFAYNVGSRNLQTSTLLRLHKEGDYQGAKGQFQRWSKAAGRVLPGLVRRRGEEAALYGLNP